MRICPKCASENRDDANFCEICGAKLVGEEGRLPEVEVPTMKRPERPKIELVLPGHEMYEEMEKEEPEEEEEDLADILSPNNGVETHGNMQAATRPKIELVLPSESDAQKKAREELDRELEERRRRREEGPSDLRPRESYSSLSKPEEKKEPAITAAPRPEFKKEEQRREERREERREDYNMGSSSQMHFETDILPGDTTWGFLSYITWIGLFISWYKTKDMQSEFMKNHLNNSLYLHLVSWLATFLLGGGTVAWAIDLVVTVFWILGMLSASKGEARDIPVISELPKIL